MQVAASFWRPKFVRWGHLPPNDGEALQPEGLGLEQCFQGYQQRVVLAWRVLAHDADGDFEQVCGGREECTLQRAATRRWRVWQRRW